MSKADLASDLERGLWSAFNWTLPRNWLMFVGGSAALGLFLGSVALAGAYLFYSWNNGEGGYIEAMLGTLALYGFIALLLRPIFQNLTPRTKGSKAFDIDRMPLENRYDYFLWIVWVLSTAGGACLPFVVVGSLFPLPQSVVAYSFGFGALFGTRIGGRLIGLMLQAFRAPPYDGTHG